MNFGRKTTKSLFSNKEKNLKFFKYIKDILFLYKNEQRLQFDRGIIFFLTNQTSLLLESVSSRATDVWHAINLD